MTSTSQLVGKGATGKPCYRFCFTCCLSTDACFISRQFDVALDHRLVKMKGTAM
jgi:hypothetical protein